MIIEAPGISQGSGAPSKANGGAPRSAAAGAIDAAAQARAASASTEGLHQAIAAANRATKSLNNSVQLSLDSQSGKAIVRVIDTETGQVIRQIPTEEVIELRRALDRVAGMLIHRTA